MTSLSTNISFIRILNATALSGTTTRTCKVPFRKLIEGFAPNRTFQSGNTNHSTKLATKPTLDSYDDELNLETLGKTRPKIEVDGMMLNWDKTGTGDHVLLLLPGVLGTIQTDFGCLFQKMDKTKYTLVSWDPPGYGGSRPPNRDFSGVFHRRDGHTVMKLMDKLGFDKFSVLGWSNGGTSALHMAADYPSRIEKIVTWCAAVYADEQNHFLSKSMCQLDLWSPKMLEPLLAIYGQEYLLKTMQEWRNSVADFRRDYKLNYALIERLPYIRSPALFIHGEADTAVTLKHAEFLKDHVANSQMSIIPKGGHNLHLRYTDEFLHVVNKFLES